MSLAYIFRKAATLAILPFGWILLLLVAALVTRRRSFVAAALAVLYLCSVPWTADRLLVALEEAQPRLSVEACPKAEAIVVLGGLAAFFAPGLPEWTEAVDRLEQAIALYQAGKAPRLVFAGGIFEWLEGKPTEGELMRDAALRRGVPAEAIQVLAGSATTAQEASRLAELAGREQVRRIILVTSAYHMPRAALLFRRQGFEVVPFPVDYRVVRGQPLTVLAFLPQTGALMNAEIALKELYGLTWYRLRALLD